MKSENRARFLGIAQGTFFIGTGLWPIVHMNSFEAVTGPKKDKWLVKTVGALLAVIGGALIFRAREEPAAASQRFLGAGVAAALALIDAVYVAKKRISPIYLADAAVEAALAGAWLSTSNVRDGHARRTR